jgi:23S rRNA pseudouridine955/2504/2580 synthase
MAPGPEPYNSNSFSLPFQAIHRFFAPSQAHRLDVGTGGLMMIAKTRDAATRLTQDLAEHKIQKRFV